MRTRQPIPSRVDGQADVFSLGLLLCEALAGERQPASKPLSGWLRGKNHEVSAALADLLAKCLATQPCERYLTAGSVASDLRRQLAHQPLKQVRNRSLFERWRKWRRRRPYALMAIFLTAALTTSCAMTIRAARQRWRQTEQSLNEAQREIDAGRFQLARLTIEHGLSLAAALPWQGRLYGDLQAAKITAEHGNRVQQLHALVGRLRALYGPQGLPGPEVDRLESDAERLWNERRLLLGDRRESQVDQPSEIDDDLADLALFWATVRQRRGGRLPVREVAQQRVDVLQEAERLVGPRLIFCRELTRLAKLVDDERLAKASARKAANLAPVSGWEHYALGRSDLNSGDLVAADQHFRAAVEMNLQSLWPNFYHGRAAYELQQYDEAVAAFSVCIVLADGAPWSYYNRGLAYAQLKHGDAARRDLDRALSLDPNLADAALERGMLSYQEQRYGDAIKDIKRALSGGANPAGVAYALALVYTATDDRATALVQLDVLFAHEPDHEGGRKLAGFLRGGDAETDKK
ncbi:MAG: tetratricopeptide repeat protein [Candidatus Saccharimonadales bacterium]